MYYKKVLPYVSYKISTILKILNCETLMKIQRTTINLLQYRRVLNLHLLIIKKRIFLILIKKKFYTKYSYFEEVFFDNGTILCDLFLLNISR